MTAEVEVLADDHDLDGQGLDQHPIDEVLGQLLGLGDVERDDHRGVDAGGGQQLEALLG